VYVFELLRQRSFIYAFALLMILSTNAFFSVPIYLIALVATYFIRNHYFNQVLPVPRNAAVVITGCSTGIGRDAAFRLADIGFTVFATVRRVEDGSALKASSKSTDRIVPLIMDVQNDDQIEQARLQVQHYLKQNGLQLLAIVNNAAFDNSNFMEVMNKQSLRKAIDVNFAGSLMVTRAFLPMIRACHIAGHSGRVIFVSSGLGRIVVPTDGAYSGSKFALEAIGSGLRMELRAWNIDVSVIEPSNTTTAINQTGDKIKRANFQDPQVIANTDPEILSYYSSWFESSRAVAAKNAIYPVDNVTDELLAAILDSRPLARYVCGRSAGMIKFIINMATDRLDQLCRTQRGHKETL